MLARALARSMDADFSRIQFTPDLLPSDVTGASVFRQKTGEFTFQPGPVFANVVLADEGGKDDVDDLSLAHDEMCIRDRGRPPRRR